MISAHSTGERHDVYTMKNALKFIARVLLSSLFFMLSINQFNHWLEFSSFANTLFSAEIPNYMLISLIVLQVIGSLLLLVGYKARWGALLLVISLIPVTMIYHHFWDLDDVSQQVQIQLFFSNVSIIGGLFYVIAAGPGHWSLDWKSHHK